MKAIYLCEEKHTFFRVYAKKTIDELNIGETVYTKADILKDPSAFEEVEYIFSTWSMPTFTSDEVKSIFKSLKCVFYAAGTVQFFARPFLENGVKVFSAYAANAVPVAEYTVSQILLANKAFFISSRFMSSGDVKKAKSVLGNYKGNYGQKVGIIGAGMIGKLVIKMLAERDLSVLVFDPFLDDEDAKRLGVTKCSLERVFSECFVISNHLANNKDTVGMLNYSLFEKMLPYATFLNTGRGAQVVEDDLVKILEERKDLTAILDVTNPEPPLEGHAFYKLENCILTPHIAGSSGNEVHRMPELIKEEYLRYVKGEKCRYEVNLEMLKTMA